LQSYEVCHHVHCQRQYDEVEEERQDAMNRRHAPDDFAGDGYVGDLRGHSNDQRKIEKIPIVRLAIVGETQSANFSVTTLTVVLVRSEMKISYGRMSTTAEWLRTQSATLNGPPSVAAGAAERKHRDKTGKRGDD
jgi:hypothetical protein